MKFSIIAPAIICLLLSGCNKEEDFCSFFHNGQNAKLLPKEFIFEGAFHYLFYYDKTGFVDSVVETGADLAAQLRVAHHGGRIDSISIFSNGNLTASEVNILYDDSGRVTQYFLNNRINTLQPPTEYTFVYQPVNTLTISRIAPNPNLNRTDVLQFDANHDATGWQVFERPTPMDLRSFTFDTGLNPLHFIKDVELMLSAYYEFTYSLHNSLTKTYYLYNDFQVNFKNYYDKHDRLIKKVYTEVGQSHPDSVEYRYFQD